jgi:cell fate regulator YaaT (PSP1 superfamily)
MDMEQELNLPASPAAVSETGAAEELNGSGDELVGIVGVRFREGGKVYYFAPGETLVNPGDPVIVETARGVEFGFAATGNEEVPVSKITPPLRPLIRVAAKKDVERWEANRALEDEAFEICRKKIEDHRLPMKLIRAEYTFDNSKLLFYFSAEVRVDFRELVKDLAAVFHTRIELRQIGIRDEAKMLGGLGVCGRPFCCATFLSDFAQVSIKMAKEQNLSLNSQKISGACGRLMCCLRYEHETYEAEIQRTPPVDSLVKTPDGTGTVTEISPLTGYVKVRLADGVKPYHRDDLTVLKLKAERKAPRND